MRKKPLITGAVFLVIVVVLVLATTGAFRPKFSVASTQHLAQDTYPLYPGVSWGAEQTATYENFSGYEAVSVPVQNVSDLSSVFQPFEQYYQQKLLSDGWSVDNSLAASGPGSDVTVYHKGGDELIVSYDSVFEGGGAGGPEQCPCDITMTVFSGSARPNIATTTATIIATSTATTTEK